MVQRLEHRTAVAVACLVTGALLWVAPRVVGVELHIREVLVLPAVGELHVPRSLSAFGEKSAIVVTAYSAAESAGADDIAWLEAVWHVQGRTVERILSETVDESLLGCVPQRVEGAYCVFRSPKDELRVRTVDLEKGVASEPRGTGLSQLEVVNGLVAVKDRGAVVWGMSALRPFAARLGAEGGVEWSVRLSEFEMGEFYDGTVTSGGVALLARSLSSGGAWGADLATIEVASNGEIVRLRAFESRDNRMLPLLQAPDFEETSRDADAAESVASLVHGITYVEPDWPAGRLLRWTRLDSGRFAYLSFEGEGAENFVTVLVVTDGDSEVARARVAGLPFASRIASADNSIYILTTDIATEGATRPRQILRLTRVELTE